MEELKAMRINTIVLSAIIGMAVAAPWAAASGVITPDAPPAVPVLRTQAFESGELKITEVSNAALELFLQDLIKRKDYDASCHNGQPGPDATYLCRWIQTVTTELLRRGYYFDSDHR